MRTRIAIIIILIHDFLFINIWLLISCDMGIYAIIDANPLKTNGLAHHYHVGEFVIIWGIRSDFDFFYSIFG